MNRTPVTRRHKATVDLVAQGAWSAPYVLTRLRQSGRISKTTLRAPASSTVTKVDLLIYSGSDYDVTTDPALVPDEDIIIDRFDIAVVGDAVVADDLYDWLKNHNGVPYDGSEDQLLWVAIKSVTASGPMAGAVLCVTAVDSV